MHAKVHKRTWKEDAAQFRRYLTGWKDRKLSSIRKSHVQKLHAEIGKQSGPFAANRLLSLLHTVFEKAREWGVEGPTPAHKIRRFKERSRQRFIRADELPRFSQALADERTGTFETSSLWHCSRARGGQTFRPCGGSTYTWSGERGRSRGRARRPGTITRLRCRAL